MPSTATAERWPGWIRRMFRSRGQPTSMPCRISFETLLTQQIDATIHSCVMRTGHGCQRRQRPREGRIFVLSRTMALRDSRHRPAKFRRPAWPAAARP